MNLKQIDKTSIGKTYTCDVEIIQIIQTKGPTLFKITDGHATFTVKSFVGAGKRAFAEFKEGDIVRVTFKVNERDGILEGEVEKMTALQNKQEVKRQIAQAQKKQSSVNAFDFIVDSSVTQKMKDRFVCAAEHIKKAVICGRPIVIRHHNDCDGYSSGVVLQRALIPLLEKAHGKRDASRYLYRQVSRTPFYAYEDALRDCSIAANNASRFGDEPPLVIIVDNGSSEEDLLGIQQGKIYGMEFIVIDHHPFGEVDVISKEVLVHINPYLVGEDYSFTAGMLCTELAYIINKDAKNIVFIAAMAGLADRTESAELDAFIRLAQEQGYTFDQLKRMSVVIDFLGYALRNLEGKGIIDDMFGEDKDRQLKTTNLLYPKVVAWQNESLAQAQQYGERTTVGETVVQFLDIEKTFSSRSYPPAGKINGLFHDIAAKKHEKVVTFGYGSDFVTVRATNEAPFDLHVVLDQLKKTIPTAFAEGGGHKKAGSIKFAPRARDNVLEFLKNSLH